jgi:predicted permease
MWTWTFWEQLGQDVRFALRTMRNNRAFTALAALSLALGIGANTAIYSFMDSILLRSLPVHNPESLVMPQWHVKRPNGMYGSYMHGNSYIDAAGFTSGVFPFPAFELFRKSEGVFSSVAGYYGAGNLNLTIKGQAGLAAGEYVSGEYFSGLGVPAAAGRLIIPADDRAGAPPAVALGFSYSQKRFGGTAEAVGQAILINNIPFTVVGVASPEFFGVDPAQAPDFFVPIHTNLLLEKDFPFLTVAQRYLDPEYQWIEVMGRLRPGISLAQAQATLAPMYHAWASSAATTDQERADLPALSIKPGGNGLEVLRRRYSKPLYFLMTLVGLILAIACANLANLLLARASARRREMALRLSMGAGRLRVIRQLLTESVLLALLGGALGLLFAVWGVRFLTLLLANGREGFTLHADLNWRVLAAAAALSMLTGLFFGLAPAIQSTRMDVMPALKELRTDQGRRRRGFLNVNLGHVLVVSQIAISVLILVSAGLFVRTLSNLESIRLGFNRENLLLFQLNARQAGHKDPEIATFYQQLQTRFRSIPGVRSVSLATRSMVGSGTSMQRISAGGRQVVSRGNLFLSVGPSFFSTMQIPILRGREIDERDQPGSAGVAVVNQLFAKAAFGDQDPLGRHITIGGGGGGYPPVDLEIVGICANARYGDMKEDLRPVTFIPYNQTAASPIDDMVYQLRTAGDPLAYAGEVREIVGQADSRVPVVNIKTQAAQIDQSINQEIIFARLCSGFAILGLAIACVGLYGALSYKVARRTGEIGIRMALGAQRSTVVRMVLSEVFVLVAVGLAISVPVALGASKLIASFLFDMKPNDPLTIVIAAAVLIAAAGIAGYAPARRASKIDPISALRHE